MSNGFDVGEVATEEPEKSGRISKVERYRETVDADRETWEVFQREDDGRPIRYVGRVRAEDAAGAHERASRLFAWYAPEVWVCPATAVSRFSAAGDGDEPATPPSGDEERTVEF